MRSFVRVFVIAVGLFLPLLVALAPLPATGVEPEVKVFLAVDAATADPQDLLTYTISIDNVGPQASPSLWVNDTLPAGTAYVSDTAATDIGPPAYVGNSTAGSTHRFQFANFPAGNLSFRISARVTLAVSDGEILRDTTLLWYTNSTGVVQPTRAASVTTTVSIPVISATKTGAFTGPTAVTYTVTIFNSGSSAALAAWWNDSIPTGLQYVSGSVRGNPPPIGAVCSSSAQWLNCTLRNPLTPGSKSWQFDATIPTPLPPGTVVTNHVYVNYTDSDETYLGEAQASAPLTIATANIQAFKFADADRVPPGGTIGYTIFYNNTGQANGRDVWINDTLPRNASLPAVTVVSTNPVPILQNQSVVKWQLSNVGTGVHYVTLVVRALASLGDGAVLTNSVTVNYTDANGNPRPGSGSSATSTVSVNVPSFAAELVASQATVEPGGTIGYTLYYNNSRPALAAFVVIEVLVPSGVALASANPVWSTSGPGKFVWDLTNVGGGVHRITLVADVPTTAVLGSTVRTIAFANYTDDVGTPVGGSQTSADVTVYVPIAAPPYFLYAGAAIAVVIVAIVFRLYLSAGETVIDEVFLLHKDGLLIKHYTRRLKPDVDSDVLSGMLIAVQNFVNESFIGEAGLKREGQLDEMKFGQYRILLTRGRDVVVAVVVSGPRMEKVPAQIRAAIEDLESALGPVLATWEGDMEAVAPADAYMQDLIAGRYRGARRLRRGNH